MYDNDWGIDIQNDVVDEQVEEALLGILTGEWSVEDTVLKGARFMSYRAEGMMTRDNGVVIELRGDGGKFALTIKRYR